MGKDSAGVPLVVNVSPHKHAARVPAAGAAFAAMSAALVRWYEAHRRDLPWRRTTDPYAILVSEVMLQQTTVAAVTPYYGRFLGCYPAPDALACADESEVLALWSGLGYYRRARLLQAAARQVVCLHGGRFPRDMAAITALPGVGRYTAGAVASFAFGMKEPIVEANSARVLARLFAVETPLKAAITQSVLWDMARRMVEASEDPRTHNYAVMELGALVCTPRLPACGGCPLSPWCAALARGLTGRIPLTPPRPEKVPVHFAAAIVEAADGTYLLRRIPAGEWHAGLYEFPRVALPPGATAADAEKLLRRHLRSLGCGTVRIKPFTQIRYTVTHHCVTLDAWRGTVRGAAFPGVRGTEQELLWRRLDEIRHLPLGSPQKRIVKMLAGKA